MTEPMKKLFYFHFDYYFHGFIYATTMDDAIKIFRKEEPKAKIDKIVIDDTPLLNVK